ncbi:MAG: hypothetical protein HZC55_01215 [Verrucomicrobia bacterium]|nr:hypothetical protein [Verrucomicrobiota bacterium]
MSAPVPRRRFITQSLLASASGVLTMQAAQPPTREDAGGKAPEGSAGPCPMGKIGKLSVSRLILGSNVITFHIHSRGLKFVNNLNRHYNTEEKILETLAVAERNGINTIMTQADPKYLRILKRHRDECGGKLQWIVSPEPKMLSGKPAKAGEDAAMIARLADEGVAGMYIHGATGDPWCAAGDPAPILRTLEAIRLNDLPAGIGGHDINVVRFCEKHNIGVDFYVKTFHHHDYPTAPKPEELVKPYAEIPVGFWCREPAETARLMRDVQKPWIAFKVMAAGAIPPENAFKYAYQNGADFVLAGMFDFEIADDVKIAVDAVRAAAARPRPWRA